MEFRKFKVLLQENFQAMTKDATHLFEVGVDKDEMWNLYLDSFPTGTNEVFRERREYDCSCCRQFIKAIGNAVTIVGNQVHTVWDFETGDTTFQPVVNALSAFIKAKAVSDIYVSKFAKIGTNSNYEEMDDGKVTTWEHFYLELPTKFDKLKSLDIEELASFLASVENRRSAVGGGAQWNGTAHALSWLQNPVED